MVVGADRLIARLRLAELDLADHAQLVELFENPVDAGAADRSLARGEKLFDLIGAQRAALLI